MEVYLQSAFMTHARPEFEHQSNHRCFWGRRMKADLPWPLSPVMKTSVPWPPINLHRRRVCSPCFAGVPARVGGGGPATAARIGDGCFSSWPLFFKLNKEIPTSTLQVFLRAWVAVDLPRLYNPVTNLLGPAPPPPDFPRRHREQEVRCRLVEFLKLLASKHG